MDLKIKNLKKKNYLPLEGLNPFTAQKGKLEISPLSIITFSSRKVIRRKKIATKGSSLT